MELFPCIKCIDYSEIPGSVNPNHHSSGDLARPFCRPS